MDTSTEPIPIQTDPNRSCRLRDQNKNRSFFRFGSQIVKWKLRSFFGHKDFGKYLMTGWWWWYSGSATNRTHFPLEVFSHTQPLASQFRWQKQKKSWEELDGNMRTNATRLCLVFRFADKMMNFSINPFHQMQINYFPAASRPLFRQKIRSGALLEASKLKNS